MVDRASISYFALPHWNSGRFSLRHYGKSKHGLVLIKRKLDATAAELEMNTNGTQQHTSVTHCRFNARNVHFYEMYLFFLLL